MLHIDRDKLHKDRVNKFMRLAFDENASLTDANELFTSEYVDKTIFSDKYLIQSFDVENILSAIPYNEVVYSIVCPYCVTENNFKTFKLLVSRNAVTPILIGNYSDYEDNISDFVYSHNHINRHEYQAFRYIGVKEKADKAACAHCVGNWKKGAERIITKNSDLEDHRKTLDRLLSNLHPYVDQDLDILDQFKFALKHNEEEKIYAISRIGATIHAVRTAQAFRSPVNVNGDDFLHLPVGMSTEADEAINISRDLSMEVAQGLGLKIPHNIRIDAYLDIVEDIRPKITNEIEKIKNKNRKTTKNSVEIQREIIKLNSEIQKISKSRRYLLLESGIEFYSKNSSILNATLLAGAFGLAGGIAGCVGGPLASGAVGAGASGVMTAAKKMKWIKTGPSTKRLTDKLSADIEPIISSITSFYLGSTTPAVNIMAMQKRIMRAEREDTGS